MREKLRAKLRSGEMDEAQVTIEATEQGSQLMQVFTSQGLEEMGMDLQEALFDSG